MRVPFPESTARRRRDGGIVSSRGVLKATVEVALNMEGLVGEHGAIDVADPLGKKAVVLDIEPRDRVQGRGSGSSDRQTLHRFRQKLDDIDPADDSLCARL